MKRKVYTDGNGSSLIDVEGLGQYLPAGDFKQQQQKIAELKAQNQKLAASLHLTISHEWCDDNYEQAKAALRANKQQCLASVKADVIKSAISDIEIGMANAHLDGDDILEYLNLELNKLREQK